MKITLYDKTITVNDDFASHYATMLGGSLSSMAKHYVACYTGGEDIEGVVRDMTEEELKEAIFSVASEELATNGVPYRGNYNLKGVNV